MDFLKKVSGSVAAKTGTTTTTPDKSAPSDDNQSSLFSSANVVADAARSTIQHEQPKHDNAEVAGAASDLLGAAQNYGKLDKTSGVGGYVDKAQSYLQEYKTSHTTKPATETPQETKPVESATKPTTTEKSAPKPSSEDLPTDSAKPPSEGEHKPSSDDEPKQGEEEPPVKEETKSSSEDVPFKEPTSEEEPKHHPSTEGTDQPTTESAKPAAVDEPKCGGKEEEVKKEPGTEPASENIPSGVGDYAKIAEGFLKKKTEGDSADQTGQCAKVPEGSLNKQSEGSADEDKGSKTGDSDQTGGLGGIAKLAGSLLK